MNFTRENESTFSSPSQLTGRNGNPLMWRITFRKDRSCSIEHSDFALQNYLESGILITNSADASEAIRNAEKRIEIAKKALQIAEKLEIVTIS